MYQEPGSDRLLDVRIFAEFALLLGIPSESSRALALLREAGYTPTLEYLPEASYDEVLPRHSRAPVLVSDAGIRLVGCGAIAGWIRAGRSEAP